MTDTLLHCERSQLDNGVQVLVVPMPRLHSVVIEAQLRAGPRYESAEDTGLSHFLEHMLYRGTVSHPSAHEQALAFETRGGTLSAATYLDHGSLGIAIPPESFGAVMELFGEVYRAPIFSKLEIEQNIVREEILEGLDDAGNEIDPDNLVRRLAYGDSALGRPITGTTDRVSQMSRQQVAAHHAQLYVGCNTVLTIAGAVTVDSALTAAQRVFGDLARGTPITPEAAQAERGPRFLYVPHASSQTQLRIAFHGPGEHEPLEAATDMLLRILDDGMSTRLYHQICDERGLCYDVSATYEAYADTGLFDIATESEHERAPEVLQEVLNLLEDLAANGPTPAELDKAKARYRFQLDELVDHPAEAAEFFGFGALTGVARTPQERWQQFSALGRADLRAAAEKLFERGGLHVVGVGGAKKRVQSTLREMVTAR
ncbi:MAG: pitrilysin family protein [Polyangiaceae bacterium]